MTVDPDALSNDDLAVSVTDDGHVVRATIDRPEKRNALNATVVSGLLDVLDAADEGEPRVVVVRGRDGNFCSGADLSTVPVGEGAQASRRSFSRLSTLVRRMHTTHALTVAAVEGYCLAGGCGLAAACEFVVAAADAEFGTPEVNVGLFPAQAMAPIMRAVSEKRGLKLLFTGERISAAEAVEVGLATESVAPAEFDARLDGLVETLAANSPVLISMGKEAYYAQRDMGFDRALSYLKEVVALLAMSEDTEEGIDAFLSDRRPEWRGR